jgi:hypothetical protein
MVQKEMDYARRQQHFLLSENNVIKRRKTELIIPSVTPMASW